MQGITFRIAEGFNDVSLNKDVWNLLLAKGPSDTVFLTKEWQQTWWDIYGRGKLLLVLAEYRNEIIAIAPLFADTGMIFFVGSGCSDYLDFIGDTSDTAVLDGLLRCAAKQITDFSGFRFYHVLENSNTVNSLKKLKKKPTWKLVDEGSMGAPILEIALYPELAESATRKKSLRRHEAYFQRNGGIETIHFQKREAILGELEQFFKQHINRWRETGYPSLFNDEQNKEFYIRLGETADQINWLRFTGIRWKNQIIAYHFGFEYKKTFMWYKPTFEIELAKNSPGEVLLRQLLLASIKNKNQCFDFGLGEEPFKERFMSNIRYVKTWGLYPKSTI